MRWTKLTMGMTAGLFMLAPAIHALSPALARQRDSRDGAVQTRPAEREERDRITGATFSSTADEQGNARFTIRVGDFLLEKALASTGDATIRLTQGKDVVSIVMNHAGYIVGRGKRTIRIDSQSGQQDDFDSVRSLLVGSSAVRTFRRLVASMENRDEADDEGPLFLSALLDGAVVDLLDGDSGATERIGKRVTRKSRARFRQAAFRPDNLFPDCVFNYEWSLVEAWDLFRQCQQAAWNSPIYVWYFSEDLCELEFLIRSQQYIYQFITCLAIP